MSSISDTVLENVVLDAERSQRVRPFAALEDSRRLSRFARYSSKTFSRPQSFTSMANMRSSTRLPRNLAFRFGFATSLLNRSSMVFHTAGGT